MDIYQLMPLIASLASAVAAVLAWVAKIKWAEEYSKAKDETIKSKEALIEVKEAQIQTLIVNKDEIIKAKEEQIKVLEREIKSLNDLTPMKIREYFNSVKEQLEEYNNLLQKQLEEAQKEVDKKNADIEKLEKTGEQKEDDIKKLMSERDEIIALASSLESQLDSLRQKYESNDYYTLRMPKIDPVIFSSLTTLSQNLSRTMLLDWSKTMSDLSKSILQIYTFPQLNLSDEFIDLLDSESKTHQADDDYIDDESNDEKNDEDNNIEGQSEEKK